MNEFLLKRMIRRPWLVLVNVIVSGTLCLLLCMLSAYRGEQLSRLEDIRGSYEINCVITDVQGKKADDLSLSHRYTDFILDKEEGLGEFIGIPLMTKSFGAKCEKPSMMVKATGITNERCFKELDPSLGGGMYSEREDFFETEDLIILVPQDVYALLTEKTLTLKLTDPYHSELGLGTSSFEFEVVGWHKGKEVIYMPYPAAQKLGVVLAGFTSTDSVSFVLSDNSRLEELSERAAQMFAGVDPSSTDYGKYALTVNDVQYKAALAALEQNVNRMSMLLPVIYLLGLGTGFLTGFLATKGETRNYALMRTVGLKRGKLLIEVLAEQLLIPLLVCAVIGIVTKEPASAAIFFACLFIGCLTAVLRPVLAGPTSLLRDRE